MGHRKNQSISSSSSVSSSSSSSSSLPTTAASSSSSLKIVLKIGTSSICDEKSHFPKLSILSNLVETIIHLKSLGHHIVLVTSGAVGTGLKRLNLDKRPKHLPQVQAVAAVGQGRLMALYDHLFDQFNQPIAQILLTRNDLAQRSQYLNAINTFQSCFDYGVIPIVNENDTICISELKYGDNDTLSAITAGLVNADYLFLLTDVDCLYTDNPRVNKDAKPIRVVDDITKLKQEITVTSPGSHLGTGGMITKLVAAELASSVGIKTIITNGSSPHRIPFILQHLSHPQNETSNNLLYTLFVPHPNSKPLSDRKWWILHSLKPQGNLYLDAGAILAIGKHKSSLFAAGVVQVTGKFERDQTVRLITKTITTNESGETVEQEVEIGKGLVNYSSAEIGLIKGCKSNQIQEALGYVDSDSIVHRDNLAVLPAFRTEEDFQRLWEKVKWKGKEKTASESSL